MSRDTNVRGDVIVEGDINAKRDINVHGDINVKGIDLLSYIEDLERRLEILEPPI